jgi:hypothetical protein
MAIGPHLHHRLPRLLFISGSGEERLTRLRQLPLVFRSIVLFFGVGHVPCFVHKP